MTVQTVVQLITTVLTGFGTIGTIWLLVSRRLNRIEDGLGKQLEKMEERFEKQLDKHWEQAGKDRTRIEDQLSDRIRRLEDKVVYTSQKSPSNGE